MLSLSARAWTLCISSAVGGSSPAWVGRRIVSSRHASSGCQWRVAGSRERCFWPRSGRWSCSGSSVNHHILKACLQCGIVPRLLGGVSQSQVLLTTRGDQLRFASQHLWLFTHVGRVLDIRVSQVAHELPEGGTVAWKSAAWLICRGQETGRGSRITLFGVLLLLRREGVPGRLPWGLRESLWFEGV